MPGRLVAPLTIAASILLLAVWASLGLQRSMAVDSVDYNGERSLLVSLGTCGADIRVRVDETDKVIVLEGLAAGGSKTNACLDGVAVELESDLADRMVVDGYTGHQLDVRRYDSAPDSSPSTADFRASQ